LVRWALQEQQVLQVLQVLKDYPVRMALMAQQALLGQMGQDYPPML
jgi:hypothetical protein